jgi:hypothetical protein
VQASTAAFPRTGMRIVTRGAYSDGLRTLLLNAAGSGFDLMVEVTAEATNRDQWVDRAVQLTGDPGGRLEITARYRPRLPIRAANLLLNRRFALLVGQLLVHYPVLWRAGWRGRAPLHASVLGTTAGTALLAGPGGVGKSTVLVAALAAGAVATADNLCCADRTSCFGIAEPLRTDLAGAPGSAARTSHGRVERPLPGRVPVLEPDRVVVLERGPRTEVTPISPAVAARALVAGTYAAGELRRYWAFAAVLALATGCGPVHPPIAAIAAGYAERLPCLRVRVADGDAVAAEQLCGEAQHRPRHSEERS